jgi:site-specific DNA recombinase
LKKKGLWMGGVAPLGYRVEDRKLVVEEEEAKIVRKIFERYVTLGSIPALQRELRGEGVVTRERPAAMASHVLSIFPWPSLTNGPCSDLFVQPDQGADPAAEFAGEAVVPPSRLFIEQ